MAEIEVLDFLGLDRQVLTGEERKRCQRLGCHHPRNWHDSLCLAESVSADDCDCPAFIERNRP